MAFLGGKLADTPENPVLFGKSKLFASPITGSFAFLDLKGITIINDFDFVRGNAISEELVTNKLRDRDKPVHLSLIFDSPKRILADRKGNSTSCYEPGSLAEKLQNHGHAQSSRVVRMNDGGAKLSHD